VNVRGGTSLAAVAKASGTTLEEIRDLNPHFLRGVAPPDEISEIRVPVGAGATFDSLLNAMPDSERLGWREVRVTASRSAQAIADEAGIPVKAIRWLNPKLALDRRGRVPEGALVRVPTPSAVAGARDVPDPSIARYGSSSGALVSKRVRVRSGESLASVARRSGMSVAQLKAMNGIKGSRVRAGQMLVVRRPSRSALARARRASAARSQRCSSRIARVHGKRRTIWSCSAASTGEKTGSARKAAARSGGRSSGSKKKTRASRR
jgi:membrane-bound lytic murein transglycosylase D